MRGLLPGNAAAQLRAVLPPQLRSFSVAVVGRIDLGDRQAAVLHSSFWTAVEGMTQLTELSVVQHSLYRTVRPELTQLTHLRKLTLGSAGSSGEYVEALKQLSQLRELTLQDVGDGRVCLLCQPPHSLQLERLEIPSIDVDEFTMRALLHLPTLTALLPRRIIPDAWPLLPHFPLLRRLSLRPGWPTPEQLTSLVASLSRCASLEDLTFEYVHFWAPNDSLAIHEQERTGWAALLSSVPNLRRLCVNGSLTNVLSVLPLHLPLLEELSLSGGASNDVDCFAAVAHPTIRLLELGPFTSMPSPSEEQLRSWPHSERLPKLERCVRRRS
jgi:hypothetical protein